jgi:uncharacterized membrane protein
MTDHVTESIIVKGSVNEIYNLWADFVNFPRFMQHIESVTPIGPDRTHWKMKGPLNTTFEWDAVTTRMEANSRIAWQSEDGNLKTSGQVTFKQLSNNQTEVTVTMHYVPPAGIAGEVAAALFAKPEKRLIEDLRNFKALAEGKPAPMSGSK